MIIKDYKSFRRKAFRLHLKYSRHAKKAAYRIAAHPHFHKALWATAGIMLMAGALYVSNNPSHVGAQTFQGPSSAAGSGSGALGLDANKNLSLGTSTPIADTKLMIVASSSASTGFAFKIIQPGASTTNANDGLAPGTILFMVRNDGKIGIGGPVGAATNTVVIAGNTVVSGTISATGFTGGLAGTVSSNNISSGAFGANTGGGNYNFPASLGIGTTTAPAATLEVYNSLGSTRVTASQLQHYYNAEANPRWVIDRDGGGSGLAALKFGPGGGTALNSTFAMVSGGGFALTGGNVGIATTSPAYGLDVAGTGRYTGALTVTGQLNANGNIQVGTAGNVYLNNGTTYGLKTNSLYIDTVNSGATTDALEIGWVTPAPVQICATASCSTYSAYFATSSFMGVGTTSPAQKFHVAGGDTRLDGTTLYYGGAGLTVAPVSGNNNYLVRSNGSVYWDADYNNDSADTEGFYWRKNAAGSTLMALAETGTLTVGGGTGKIDAGTIDPIYTINGVNYATYLPAMTGVKEETSDVLTLNCASDPCRAVLDIAGAPKGSDLWLFGKSSDWKKHMKNMSVLLTPSFAGQVWYTKDMVAGKVTVYARPAEGESREVSYRLTAPRFDADAWSNYNNNPSAKGFIIND
jgi:hypothetical protein